MRVRQSDSAHMAWTVGLEHVRGAQSKDQDVGWQAHLRRRPHLVHPAHVLETLYAGGGARGPRGFCLELLAMRSVIAGGLIIDREFCMHWNANQIQKWNWSNGQLQTNDAKELGR